METAAKEMNTVKCDKCPHNSKDTSMNDSGEGRKEDTDSKMEVLSANRKTIIEFWNQCRLYNTGNITQVTAWMNLYNLHIIRLSVSRWRSGRYRTITGKTVFYNGGNVDLLLGVALTFKKGLLKSLMESSQLAAG